MLQAGRLGKRGRGEVTASLLGDGCTTAIEEGG